MFCPSKIISFTKLVLGDLVGSGKWKLTVIIKYFYFNIILITSDYPLAYPLAGVWAVSGPLGTGAPRRTYSSSLPHPGSDTATSDPVQMCTHKHKVQKQ